MIDAPSLVGGFKFCCSDLSQMRTHAATGLLALILSLRFVARIQTSLNSCDRSRRQNSIAARMISFTCHTRRFIAATCRGDVSQRFVVSCVLAYNVKSKLPKTSLYRIIYNTVEREIFKVKNDHRGKFSNLNREETWKKSWLQRDSNPWPTQ